MSDTYSLAAQCGSEMIASCLIIYLGESIIANELLAKTKGRAMGWGFVALGFGLAFGVGIMMFGYISAHVNPATCLALWVIGKMPFTHLLAISASELAGMFVGALLVWLHFLPHFKTVPEPAPKDATELLLRSRDYAGPDALNIASYDTRPLDTRHVTGVKAGVARAVKDLRYYLNDTVNVHVPEDMLVTALGREELRSGAEETTRSHGLRRHSVQVCDVHRRLKDMSIEEYAAKLHLAGGGGIVAVNNGSSASTDGASVCAEGETLCKPSQTTSGDEGSMEPGAGGESPSAVTGNVRAVTFRRTSAPAAARGQPLSRASSLNGRPVVPDASGNVPIKYNPKDMLGGVRCAYEKHIKKHEDRVDRLYSAAIVADQNAKLTIFCTRPAIYTPILNFVCEVMSTAALVFGALMLYQRREMLLSNERDLFRSIEGMWIGFFVFVVILGLGGPTGIAANPARDFGPRVAHWLLPIVGKGPTEWHYAWIPGIAPFFGGAIAGGFYKAVQLMNQSNVVLANPGQTNI